MEHHGANKKHLYNWRRSRPYLKKIEGAGVQEQEGEERRYPASVVHTGDHLNGTAPRLTRHKVYSQQSQNKVTLTLILALLGTILKRCNTWEPSESGVQRAYTYVYRDAPLIHEKYNCNILPTSDSG